MYLVARGVPVDVSGDFSIRREHSFPELWKKVLIHTSGLA